MDLSAWKRCEFHVEITHDYPINNMSLLDYVDHEVFLSVNIYIYSNVHQISTWFPRVNMKKIHVFSMCVKTCGIHVDNWRSWWKKCHVFSMCVKTRGNHVDNSRSWWIHQCSSCPPKLRQYSTWKIRGVSAGKG